MNEIDCKIVLEEYVLLHQAYENQEFKRLLPILEQHKCVHAHRAMGLVILGLPHPLWTFLRPKKVAIHKWLALVHLPL